MQSGKKTLTQSCYISNGLFFRFSFHISFTIPTSKSVQHRLWRTSGNKRNIPYSMLQWLIQLLQSISTCASCPLLWLLLDVFHFGAHETPVICSVILKGSRQSLTATVTEVKDPVQIKAARTCLENNLSIAFVYLAITTDERGQYDIASLTWLQLYCLTCEK